MSESKNQDNQEPQKTFLGMLRNYFLTGLVISAPIFITFYLIRWVVELLDGWFTPFIPHIYRPETYLPFEIPGVGVVMALVTLTLIGWFTANFFGRYLVGIGDRIMKRMPVVGTIYTAIKQIMHTAVSQDSKSFSQVALIEYPRPGLHAIAFVTKAADHRVNEAGDKKMIGVFLPTTPNPTSGFLLFVPEDELIILDMTVEEGARLVISAGLSDEEV